MKHLITMAVLAVTLAGCTGGIGDPQGPVVSADQQMMRNALEIMLVIVVPTIFVALGFAWWFRASNRRAKRRPDWVYSGRIELIVWSIPILVILFIAGVIWVGSSLNRAQDTILAYFRARAPASTWTENLKAFCTTNAETGLWLSGWAPTRSPSSCPRKGTLPSTSSCHHLQTNHAGFAAMPGGPFRVH